MTSIVGMVSTLSIEGIEPPEASLPRNGGVREAGTLRINEFTLASSRDPG